MFFCYYLLLGDCSFIFINALRGWEIARPPWSLKDSDRPPDWVQRLAVPRYSLTLGNCQWLEFEVVTALPRLQWVRGRWTASMQFEFDVGRCHGCAIPDSKCMGRFDLLDTFGKKMKEVKSDPASLIHVLCFVWETLQSCVKFFRDDQASVAEPLVKRPLNLLILRISISHACSGSCISASLSLSKKKGKQIGDGMSWVRECNSFITEYIFV